LRIGIERGLKILILFSLDFKRLINMNQSLVFGKRFIQYSGLIFGIFLENVCIGFYQNPQKYNISNCFKLIFKIHQNM